MSNDGMLTLDDLNLAEFSAVKDVVSKASPIQRMRGTHHYAARLLAEGRRPFEVCALTGYSNSRISILQNDPSFKELMRYYKDQVDGVYLGVHERVGSLALAFCDELQERLEDHPEKFTNRELADTAEMLLDRSIAPAKGGPKAQAQQITGVQVNVSFAELPEQGKQLPNEVKAEAPAGSRPASQHQASVFPQIEPPE